SAIAAAKADPIVKNRLWSAEVIPWITQKGVLHPITNYDQAARTTYFLGFLKRGDKWSSEDTPERQRIQDAHLANIKRLYEMGKLVAAGPFTDDTELRGIFVFKTGTMQEALELTNTAPAVKAGRLRIELYPWELPATAFSQK